MVLPGLAWKSLIYIYCHYYPVTGQNQIKFFSYKIPTVLSPSHKFALEADSSSQNFIKITELKFNGKANSMTSETVNQATSSKPSVFLEDFNEIQKVFERFDTNKDGKISSAELDGVMKALGSDTSAEEVSRIMQEVDTDKDGYINLEEFAAFCNSDSISGGVDGGLKELHEAFELYDRDHDGFITADELHQILTRLGESCSLHDCEKMIKSVDSNGDGKVSFDEFTKMMTNSAGKPPAP